MSERFIRFHSGILQGLSNGEPYLHQVNHQDAESFERLMKSGNEKLAGRYYCDGRSWIPAWIPAGNESLCFPEFFRIKLPPDINSEPYKSINGVNPFRRLISDLIGMATAALPDSVFFLRDRF